MEINDPKATLPPGDPRHGINGYTNLKCKCVICTKANREATAAYIARKSAQNAVKGAMCGNPDCDAPALYDHSGLCHNCTARLKRNGTLNSMLRQSECMDCGTSLQVHRDDPDRACSDCVYQRGKRARNLKRYGSETAPESGSRERFFSQVEQTTDNHWFWKGQGGDSSPAMRHFQSKDHTKRITVSRYAWWTVHGVVPTRRLYRDRAKCNESLCINPAHRVEL